MRADRLISLTLLLQARGRVTAQTLAQTLEVSERTVYRDLDALTAAGIPVYAQSGPNGGIYLDEHYRLLLTGLSRHDLQALFVAGDLAPLKDLGLAQTQTLLKLFAALPSGQRNEVEQLRQRFHVDTANWFQVVEQSPFFALIQQAVWDDRRLKVRYQSVEGQPREQLLDAYALVAKSNLWYLVAKQPEAPSTAMRTYRLSRLQATDLTAARFARDPDFDLAAYWQRACEQFERDYLETVPPYPALLRVDSSAQWYFPGFLEGHYRRLGEPDADGWITLEVTFQSMDDARTRVLGLGAHVDVLEPDALRQAVYATARAILQRAQPDNSPCS